MPFRSSRQRAYMYENHPEIAKRWADEHGNQVVPKRKDGKSDMRRVKPAAKRMR